MVSITKTGNSELDEQHGVMQACLADLVNLLGRKCDPATLLPSFEALRDYTEWHFAFEERLLKRSNFPDRARHMAEHGAIINQLHRLHDKLANGSSDAIDLISALTHWIVDHVNHEDMELARYLDNKRGAAGARHPEAAHIAPPTR